MLPGKEKAYNSLIVKQDNGIVIVEVPYSNANSEAIRDYAAKAFPSTPIIGVVSTNQIWLHIAGLPAYAKRGVPILLRETNRELVSRLLRAQIGDYQFNASAARLRTVRSRSTVGTGVNRMELIPFEGGAGSKMLAVYFPGHKLLYCSDLYLPVAWGHQYWIEHLAEIRELIRNERLEVLQVTGVSTPPHDWADLIVNIPEMNDENALIH